MIKSMEQKKRILKRRGINKKGAIADSLGFFVAFVFMIFVIILFLVIAKVLTSPVASTLLGRKVLESQIISREDLPKFAQTDTTLLNYVRSPLILNGKEKTVADVINDVVHKKRDGVLRLNLVFEIFRQAGFMQATSRLFNNVQDELQNLYYDGYGKALKDETKQILDAAYGESGKWALFITKPDGTLIFYQFSDNANTDDILYFDNALSMLAKLPNQPDRTKMTDLSYSITYSSVVIPIKETNIEEADTVLVYLMSTNVKAIS